MTSIQPALGAQRFPLRRGGQSYTMFSMQKPILQQDNLRITVTGFNEWATTAIRAANEHAYDFLEVPWSAMDSIMRIMKRLEDRLCIPAMYWRLAADGVVLDQATLTCAYPVFTKTPAVDLTLVPIDAVDEYIEACRREPKTPTQTSPSTFGQHERAAAFFHLLDPIQSSAWPVYVQQRTHASALLQKRLSESGETDPLIAQIRAGIAYVLSATKLDPPERTSVADGVTPLYLNWDLSDGGQESASLMGDAEVWTRIHSPSRPAALDVHFAYRHYTTHGGVDYSVQVLYREHNPLTRASIERREAKPEPGHHDWRLLFVLGLQDAPSGRVEQREKWWDMAYKNVWGLKATDVNRLHGVLFGTGTRGASAFGRLDTVRFVLAAVGVPLHVAREESDKADRLELQALSVTDTLRWDINDCQWLGYNIRKACGAVLPGEVEPQFARSSLAS